MKIYTIALIILSFVLSTNLSAQNNNDTGFSMGYHFSNVDYVNLNLDYKIIKFETRIMVNKETQREHDLGLMLGINVIRKESYKMYIGGILMLNTNWNYTNIAMRIPIGGIIYPFDNKRLGIQLEFAPELFRVNNTDRYLADNTYGSIGIRYIFKTRAFD